MASGDVLVPPTGGQTVIKLLDAISGAGADNGQWVSAGEFDIGCVVVTGAATTTTVEVDASNDLALPANATHGAPIGVSAAGATAYVSIPCCPRWVKARILATGTGTINAFAVLRSVAGT